MAHPIDRQHDFPMGRHFLTLLGSLEGKAERVASRGEGHSPEGAALRDQFGNVLSLLYRVASCYWGCHGREHIFEYLAGRTSTSALAAHRLIGFGYYDEALALSRNIAEIGNLVQLFFSDEQHIRCWLDSPERERRREYGPAAVRRKLAEAGSVVPTDEDEYSWLCEIATHVTPDTIPQGHNPERRPILGGVHQPDGSLKTFTVLAWSLCTVAGPIAKLAILERSPAEQLVEEVVRLAEGLASHADRA